MEVFFFRSLFRNSRAELHDGPKLAYGSSKWLWMGAMAFHWSFLFIIIRHLRFFIEPSPVWATWLQNIDGLFEIGLPALYITDALVLAALSYLLIRRIIVPQLRYISLLQDYFPPALLLGITISGAVLRYFIRTDLYAVKKLALGLAHFTPSTPAGISPVFYMHLFLVCVLFAYLPFSKLTHMAGVFLSPTRNLANTNRKKRHVNPWNQPVKVHTYEEWEDEFRDKMKTAGYATERD